MKKSILYSMLLTVGLSFSACSDQFLEDMTPYDKYSPEKTFGNETNLDKYIQNVYYNFYYKSGMTPVQSYGLTGVWNDYTAYTEEKWGIQSKIDASNEFVRADECDGYFGADLSGTLANNPYTRIRSCNEILEGVDKYGQALSESAIKKAKGQAYFFRALQLFDLVRVYGSVPIVTKVLDASDREGAKAYVRESVEKCIAQVVSDLDEAANLLPTYKNWGAAQYGRLTKEAALAYKSRVLLVYASPIFNSDWDNTTNQRWIDALKATQEAKTFLDAEGYGLYGSSAKEWDEMFYKNDNKWCKETIMVKMMAATEIKEDEHSGWQKAIRLSTMGGSGNGFQVPQGMIDLFPMADGKPATDAQGNPQNGYDPNLFFLNRDPRFYYTFTFSGMKWGYDKGTDAVVWNYRWNKDQKTPYPNYLFADNLTSSCPALVRKMSDPTENSANTYQYDGTDIYEYRYAELLLNLAECQAATGNASEAVATIGQIRKRVGIPATNQYGLGNISDKYEAIKACLQERQIELAYEGKRYWDIWRWMLYNDDSNNNNKTCEILNLKPLNGTYRVGKVLQVKSGYTLGANDPVKGDRTTFTPVDVADWTNLQTNLKRLATFWSSHFEMVNTNTPVDEDSNHKQAYITWKQNYYLSGLKDNVLTMNPWLLQSKGWKDAYGAEGTLDARK